MNAFIEIMNAQKVTCMGQFKDLYLFISRTVNAMPHREKITSLNLIANYMKIFKLSIRIKCVTLILDRISLYFLHCSVFFKSANRNIAVIK